MGARAVAGEIADRSFDRTQSWGPIASPWWTGSRLLMVQWVLVAVATALSVAALLAARRVSQKLDRLTEAYWALRYEHTGLRARVAALEPPAQEAAAPRPPTAGTSFVPLSSLRK
jgi:hypothetical protein